MVENKLLVVLITYNRLEYTKKTLSYFWKSIDVPYYLIVIDNCSTDGTIEYLKRQQAGNKIDKVIFNPENYYPGKACNIAWEEGLKEYPATHLMRLDNDMILRKGWDIAALDYFKKIPSMGQVGIEHEAIENPNAYGCEVRINGKTYNTFPGTVGGPNIISRLVWEKGLRYDESRWTDNGTGRPTLQEDVLFSRAIKNAGFLVGHMTEDLARTFANETNWKEYPEYYTQTFTERGYGHLLEKLK